jgi:hypothetical protein
LFRKAAGSLAALQTERSSGRTCCSANKVREQDEDDNLQALCKSCHAVKTTRFMQQRKKLKQKIGDTKENNNIKKNINNNIQKPNIINNIYINSSCSTAPLKYM